MHHIQHEIGQCLAMYSIISRPTMFSDVSRSGYESMWSLTSGLVIVIKFSNR